MKWIDHKKQKPKQTDDKILAIPAGCCLQPHIIVRCKDYLCCKEPEDHKYHLLRDDGGYHYEGDAVDIVYWSYLPEYEIQI